LGGNALTGSTETSGVGFFAPSDLPELSLGRVTPWQIQRLAEYAAAERELADFD
jgi:hypothetical protein